MKTQGNVTTFDHVQRIEFVSAGDLHIGSRLFMVGFDGEWDLWTSKKNHPTAKEIDACIDELKEYYERDWKGTNREISIFVAVVSRHKLIDCK